MVGALIVLGIGAIVIVSIVAVDSFDDAINEAASNSTDLESGNAPAGGDEANDVGPCAVIDDNTIELDITNNSSKQSSYVVDVNFLDAGGQRVADEPFFVNYIRPGERAVEQSYAFSLEGAVACEIAEVERFASASPGNTDEVTCSITGVDFADDVTADLVATNGSSELSDYFIDFAVVRDGVRVGSGFAAIENIRPGESAPGEGFTVAPGPAEGATCQVVNVNRTAS